MDEQNKADLRNLLRLLDDKLREAKPQDRSELDRRVAIAITDCEKLAAYIEKYCLT